MRYRAASVIWSFVAFNIFFFGFWVVNIVQLVMFHSLENALQNTEVAMKFIGIIIVPLGSIMGIIGLF